MRKAILWARWMALLIPATAQAAVLPLAGIYGSKEVCDAIAANGNTAALWDDPTLEGIMFSPDGYHDSETACTFDKVVGPPGAADANNIRWTVTATCHDTVRVHVENFRLLERPADGLLTILQGDEQPFSLRLCGAPRPAPNVPAR